MFMYQNCEKWFDILIHVKKIWKWIYNVPKLSLIILVLWDKIKLEVKGIVEIKALVLFKCRSNYFWSCLKPESFTQLLNLKIHQISFQTISGVYNTATPKWKSSFWNCKACFKIIKPHLYKYTRKFLADLYLHYYCIIFTISLG